MLFVPLCKANGEEASKALQNYALVSLPKTRLKVRTYYIIASEFTLKAPYVERIHSTYPINCL